MAYLSDNYIYRDSLFPPTLWARPPDGTASTTNCAESFHSRYNGNFYKAHPHIFQVIDVLCNCDLQTRTKLNSIRKNKFYIKRDEIIDQQALYYSLYLSYTKGEMTRDRYLFVMGNYFRAQKK